MTDQTIMPGRGDGEAGPAAAPTPAAAPAPPAPRRTPRRRVLAGTATAGPYRVVTANVQSFPVNAISLPEALEDLRRNAADGDVVLLQEIAARYKTLIQMAFPSAEWVVYYGRSDNSTPIAFRRALFSKVEGRVELLHPAVRHLHFRRYMTHLRLRARDLRFEFHVINLHLVAGAFNGVDEPDQDLRLAEWNDGIAKHQRLVESLVETGLPVVGGGDYNRRLEHFRSVGTEIAGKQVTYAVDGGSIDLLWFIDGDESGWGVRSTKVFPGRRGKSPQRNSDHSMRRATVTLTGTPATAPVGATGPAGPKAAAKPGARPKAAGTPKVRPHRPGPAGAAAPAREELPLPGPFELTTFGDGTAKRVDWKTRAALEEAQALLGYPLTLVQGSYNRGGVSASAGTHDAGGVVDLLAWDWQRKVRALRKVGFAAWYRAPVRGLWGAHIHAVLIDHGRLAPVAARQVTAYRNGRDGLRSNLPDRFWRPSPIPVFQYPPKRRPEPLRSTPRAHPATAPTAGAYPPKRTLDGVDTSHHQGGRIDLKAAQQAGLRWWYLKATEGDTIKDSTYRKRVKQARNAGIPVGAYHFARPDPGDAAKEARFFLKNADIRAGDMLPMLDLESLEGMSLAEVTTWTGRWVHTVTQDLRRRGLVARPIIYTPFSLGNAFQCLLWVARYSDDFRPPTIPKPWRNAVIWQHSNGRYGPVKHVPGFGPVDVNAVHPDVPLSALRVKRVRKAAPQPAPGPRPDPGPTPAGPVDVPVVPEPVDVPFTPEPVDVPVTPEPVDVPVAPEPVDVPVTPQPTLPAAPAPAEADVNQLIDLAVARVQLELAQQQLEAALARLPER
ncbi:MAG: GH25 family lysozyme [Nocardioides sp.]